VCASRRRRYSTTCWPTSETETAPWPSHGVCSSSAWAPLAVVLRRVGDRQGTRRGRKDPEGSGRPTRSQNSQRPLTCDYRKTRARAGADRKIRKGLIIRRPWVRVPPAPLAQVSDLRKRSSWAVGASTSPERTESAAREFGLVAGVGSASAPDLHGCTSSQRLTLRYMAPVAGWALNSGRRLDAGKPELVAPVSSHPLCPRV
jgi:hypothetical protein